jgi:hypothetical protein
LKSKADWAPKDFGKPNIERFGAESRVWEPSLVECHDGRTGSSHRIVAQLRIDDPEAERSGRTAWPQKMYLEIILPDAEAASEIHFSWFGKAANRMPEALWLSFIPPFGDARGWKLEKSGGLVSPFDVVTGGNRAMHAVLGGLHYSGPEGALSSRWMRRWSPSERSCRCISPGASPISRKASTSAFSITGGEQTTSNGSAKICGSASGF